MNSIRVKKLTLIGLLLAFFATPLIVFVTNTIYPNLYTDKLIIVKELSIFASVALLILIIIKGEKLGLDSIGLHNRHWGKTILWGFLIALINLVALIIIAWFLQSIGVQVGGNEGNKYENVSLLVMNLVVLRAGVVEEICYRGYAMERLKSINNNKYFFVGIPLIIFALVHYTQGWAGIFISFILGGIMAIFYLKKRDLKALIIAHFIVDFIPNILIPLIDSLQTSSSV